MEANADQVGLVAAGVVGAAVAAHAAVTAIKRAAEKSRPRSQGDVTMAVIETQGFKLDNSGRRIVVDPISRIEGHLRIECNVDAEERHHQRRLDRHHVARPRGDPQGARPARRVGVHRAHLRRLHRRARARLGALRSRTRSASRSRTTPNIIRNLMHATLYAQDHLVHFYHLHALDWVDVVSALKADPKTTSELAQSISAGRTPRPATTATCSRASRSSSNRASSGRSGTATGATRPTSCRRKPT